MKHWILVIALALVGAQAWAAIDTYEFQTEQERARYRHLTEVLRCPKCQNQNIADSNAPIAMDLRNEVYQMMEKGYSDPEIVQFLVDRYGDFVLYEPPLDKRTMVLWYGPIVLLVSGLLLVGVMVYRRRRVMTTTDNPLSEAERARVASLLENHKDD